MLAALNDCLLAHAADGHILYLEVITRLSSYRHLYQAREQTSARDEVEG